MALQQYSTFLAENEVLFGTPEQIQIQKIGQDIAMAA